MIHNIIIQPVNPMRMSKLPRVFSHGNKLLVITPDFDYHEYDNSRYISATNSKNPDNYPIAYTEDILFTITSFKPSDTLQGGQKREDSGASSLPIYKFSYETVIGKNKQEEGKTAEDRRKKKAHEFFFNIHPMTLVNGKSHHNTKTPVFNVVDYAMKAKEDESIFDLKLAIATRIASMEFEEMADVAYYFGANPKNMTEGQLKIMLADFNSGICVDSRIHPGQAYSNIQKFQKEWLKDEVDEETMMRTTLQKAIRLEIITNNKKGGLDSFYLGTSPIGNTIDDMITYFRKEHRTYDEFIVREVKKKNNLRKEKKEAEVSKNDNSGSEGKKYTPTEVIAMRDEIKQLKQQGFVDKGFAHNATIPNLVKELDAGRLRKKEKEAEAV